MQSDMGSPKAPTTMTSFRLCDVGMKGGCRGGVLASQEKGGYCFQNDRGHKSELFILLNLPCFLSLVLGIILVPSRSPLVHPIKRLPIGEKAKKKKKKEGKLNCSFSQSAWYTRVCLGAEGQGSLIFFCLLVRLRRIKDPKSRGSVSPPPLLCGRRHYRRREKEEPRKGQSCSRRNMHIDGGQAGLKFRV